MNGGKSVAASPASAPKAPAAGGGAGAAQETRASSYLGMPFWEGEPAPALPLHDKRGARMRNDWPLRSYLELGILQGSVPCARLHAKHVLWEWGLSELSDSVELLVSELVTNAIRVSQSTNYAASVRLWLRSDKSRVQLLVWDGNPRPPVRMEPGEEAESGRGLLLVDAISDRWDWFQPNGWEGKIVWAEVSLQTSDELPRQNPGEPE